MIASRDLFYRIGLHQVGVDAIAEAALTNKMTLYRHFKSKDDLIVAYIELLAKEGDDIWERILSEHKGNPDLQLNGWVDYIEDVLTNKYERGCALANAAVELDSEHPAKALIETYKRRKRANIVKVFKAARYAEPERLADEVFLLFEGARISIQCGGKGPARRVVSMLRNLLAAGRRLQPEAAQRAQSAR
ncbi:TetR/AcrR family transcriptional regulator [Hyphomicrobium methylovorum]|uniref:TetR/AcrR family transcriptional regulator n=1 Tax=Hyphomicrobium methylovorum TaxID=84 RepID=UPI001FE4A970|nr:TetR/AcrR family transcriptional regulator [Hyphomicrobium methylovorum]